MSARKVVINTRFGGFGLSQVAYEKLSEWGVPIRRYVEQEQGSDGRWLPQPLNDGEVIFDRDLTPRETGALSALYHDNKGKSSVISRYWDAWISYNREHPLIVRVVEELGEAANGECASLKVVEIPEGVEYTIEEYDGREHIAEVHRTWS